MSHFRLTTYIAYMNKCSNIYTWNVFSKYVTSQNHQNRHLYVPLYVRISLASVWQASFPLPTWKCFIKSSVILKERNVRGWRVRTGLVSSRARPRQPWFPPPEWHDQEREERLSDNKQGKGHASLWHVQQEDELTGMTGSPRLKKGESNRPYREASRAQACSLHRACVGPPTSSVSPTEVAGWWRLQGKKPVAGRMRKKGKKRNTEAVAALGEQVEAVIATSETKTQRRGVGACRKASALLDLHEVQD